MRANYIIQARQASTEYEAARRSAVKRKLGAAILRRRNSLLSLDDVTASAAIQGERYLGVRQVPVHCIVSSIGRQSDFDAHFGPLHDRTRERWVRVANAHLNDTALPPVHLLKIGDTYVVKDGNHRVSVARHFGVEYIDAEIVEYLACRAPRHALVSNGSEARFSGRYSFWSRSLIGQKS